ncbi:hypothetical protein [Streptomyces chumphonensis]|uniref:hypothetical protein n=1 Tax=Streptomyces chumphonensis TaxID=1214925 RepID=UPI003D70F77D
MRTRGNTGTSTPPRSARWEHFADPFTRRLVGHTGSTTEQLRLRTGQPLLLRLVSQRTGPPPEADRLPLPHAARPAPGTPWLVRVTELVTPQGLTVSRNLVTGRVPAAPAVLDAVTCPRTPLGSTLLRTGMPQRRTLLSAGTAPWPGAPGSPAVRRGYLLHLADEAPLYVVEHFNPAVVPSGRRPSGGGPARSHPREGAPA